jgi:YesN/AraC family two-component response regulator
LARFYTVLLAKNGEEGLQMANDTIPDLIISDIVMPIMDGIELCKAVKSDVKTSHIPVILLTAKTTTNERIEGLGSGADAYIAKPFHLKLLQTQIAGLIQSRQELYARFSQDVFIMSRKQTGNDVDQHFLQSTIDYILSNLTDTKLNIESLSSYHNMSHRNYYRKIKALTGNTVVEFIKIVRLKEALKLMEKQQYSLSEISYMTGFASPSYFTKNFREFYGKPPSEYLKS